jgi:hypothetical protein
MSNSDGQSLWNPGWYEDGNGQLRYWDGSQWTERTRPLPPMPSTGASSMPVDRRDEKNGVLRRVPVTTWVGIAATALLAIICLASGGVWLALASVALVVLVTGVCSLVLRRPTWLRLPAKRATGVIGVAAAIVVLIGASSAYGLSHPVEPPPSAQAAAPIASQAPAQPSPTAAPSSPPTHVPLVITRDAQHLSVIPFASTTVSDASMPKGTTKITTVGVNGLETKTYTVTFTDGKETDRVLKSDTTVAPVAQVTSVGTYVARAQPAPSGCTNGTYVNSAGNTVCSPEVSPAAPAGATAQCQDGTWSFSQSRRGTCSSHGGVAEWL